jgi:hypothetical protein
MLAITTDCPKQPPFVVFNKEKLSKDKFLPGITVRF